MQIEFKEIKTFDQFEEISKLQNTIWNLSDRDIISTISLRALSMKYPLMGLIMGAYDSNKLVGFAICMPTREPSTLYGLIMGVLPEYQRLEIGNSLGVKILEKCLQQGINKICWTFDPLEVGLGQLYINKWGAVAVRYEKDYYQLRDEQNSKIPQDRFVVDCNLMSNRVIERINKKTDSVSLKKSQAKFPVAEENNYPDSPEVLIKIPNNFGQLKKSNPLQAIQYRMKTRKILEEYISNRTYFIASMLMEEVDGERQYYYLMEKRSYI
jgi:predicted GNAT superfamily acetyltransferase